MHPPPIYIQESGVLDAPAKFPWKGKGAHYGPEQGTKLHTAFQKLTVCAEATVCALVEEWLLWRLSSATDAQPWLDHVDATLAWEIDPRYRDENAVKFRVDTSANQAIRDAVMCVGLATDDRFWESPATADDKAAAVVSVTRQTLEGKLLRSFNTWLEFALTRAAKLDPKPKAKRPRRKDFDSDEQYYEASRPYFGRALPREALDPNTDYTPSDREKLLRSFLEGLDWKKNRFLRSPEKMKKLGFKGTPYKL